VTEDQTKTRRTRDRWFYAAVTLLLVAIVVGTGDSWYNSAGSWLLIVAGLVCGAVAALRSRKVQAGDNKS
jgi:hypothetical protein